MQTISVLKLEK